MADNILQPVHAVRMSLPLTGEKSLDCYELPDGTKRVGFEGSAVALGHESNWVGRLPKNSRRLFKALQDEGFTGYQIPVSVKNPRGATIAKTLSVRDFVKLVGQDALLNGNRAAIILLLSFAEVGLERAISDLFSGHSTEYLLQKIVHYSEWTYEQLQEVLEYNRQEVRNLYLRGSSHDRK